MKPEKSIKENIPLVNRPILPTLLYLSWPIMLGETMQLMYNLADTFWLGRLGPEFIAAISVSFPLIFIVFSVAAGFSIAGVALVAQYTGAGREEEANLAAGQILVFSVVVSLLFSASGLIFGRRLLLLLGTEPQVLPHAWSYFSIITAGIPLIFVYFIFSSVLQGVGDSITPMKLKVGAVLFNMILDPFLIFGWWIFPDLGIKGAAFATIISRFIVAGVGVYYLFGGKKIIKLRAKHLYPDMQMMKDIIRIGSPAAAGDSALALALTVMTSIVAHFGTFSLAAWGIGNRITSLIRMPAMGLGRATGVLVGQHLGADQPNEAGKTAWLGAGLIFCLMILVALLILISAPQIMMVFTDDKDVIRIGSDYLKIAGFAYALLGVQQVLSGALQGAGKTLEQTFFRIFGLWVLQIPLSILFAHTLGWGKDGIWWAIITSKFIGLMVIVLWFVGGTWKKKVIKDNKV